MTHVMFKYMVNSQHNKNRRINILNLLNLFLGVIHLIIKMINNFFLLFLFLSFLFTCSYARSVHYHVVTCADYQAELKEYQRHIGANYHLNPTTFSLPKNNYIYYSPERHKCLTTPHFPPVQDTYYSPCQPTFALLINQLAENAYGMQCTNIVETMIPKVKSSAHDLCGNVAEIVSKFFDDVRNHSAVDVRYKAKYYEELASFYCPGEIRKPPQDVADIINKQRVYGDVIQTVLSLPILILLIYVGMRCR